MFPISIEACSGFDPNLLHLFEVRGRRDKKICVLLALREEWDFGKIYMSVECG
jgi:hypothetical protein